MSNNPPLLGAGAGTEISFSTLRDFYSDTNPVSLSEFTRGGSLVASTFAGVSTATTSTGSATKNDFVITSTDVLGSPTSSSISSTGSSAAFINVLSTTSRILLNVSGSGTAVFYRRPDPNSATLVLLSQTDSPASLAISGPNYDSSDGSVHSAISEGQQFVADGSGAAQVTGGTHITRPGQFDITFKNNNSTGDTYTLASSSTRIGSNSQVYAAQDSRQVKDNSSSGQWTIAYDNVTGSGSGTAGDIAVTVTSQADAGTETHNGGNGTASATAPSLSGISFVSVVGIAQDSNDNNTPMVTLKRNGTTVAQFRAGSGVASFVTYTGTINSGDVFTAQGGDQSNVVTINYTTPSRSIVFQNNGSASLTIGSNSTGGARTIASGASSTVQSGGSTNNEDWQVHFDTSSGDCNVGIPATISSGNPVNMDVFNTVTTPVG